MVENARNACRTVVSGRSHHFSIRKEQGAAFPGAGANEYWHREAGPGLLLSGLLLEVHQLPYVLSSPKEVVLDQWDSHDAALCHCRFHRQQP
jgi:hypothetical protein